MNEEDVRRLVRLFEGLSPGQRQRYSEDDTKANLIEPLFSALGWHMDDEQEVQRNRRSGSDQPDYTFRLTGVIQFFVEAKRLHADLDDMQWVKQTITYAFNKGVPWAVLTNFQRLIVFDAYEELSGVQARPRPVLDLTFDRYLDPGARLGLLERDANPLQRLNQHAQEIGARRRPVPPERQLYDAMRTWREGLVNALLSATQAATPDDMLRIEEAVQRLLDRLMFLRNCEDRGVGQPRLRELYNELSTARQRSRPFRLAERLQRVFSTAASTYDSELFATTSYLDTLLPQVDGLLSEALSAALDGLYQPAPRRLAPYDFKHIDADVLGAMYEQYLGHVAQRRRELAAQHERQLTLFGAATPVQVDIAPQRRRRSEQGIFYTPRWVVDYIVRQTLGRWLEEHGDNAESLDQLAVLDPASGSGSFLIRAYETLLDFHAQRQGGTVDQLDRRVRERILRRHIYGVDLDRQAVEIARLNLLLRMVQEEELLPPLAENIVWGNSLVAGGEAELRPWFGDDWEAKRPLTWERTFREVMGRGGFDVVIGNPPYVQIQSIGQEDRDYLRNNFETARGSFDLYVPFIEQAVKLLRPSGFLGVITSGKFLRTEYGKQLRILLSEVTEIVTVIDLINHQIFSDATNYPTILICRKRDGKQPYTFLEVPPGLDVDSLTGLDEAAVTHGRSVLKDTFAGRVWPPLQQGTSTTLEKVDAKGMPLGQIASIFFGTHTGADDVFIVAPVETSGDRVRIRASDGKLFEIELSVTKKIIKGDRRLRRWSIDAGGPLLIFPYRDGTKDLIPPGEFELQFPDAFRYLRSYEEALRAREGGRLAEDNWYSYTNAKNHELLHRGVPRIITRTLAPYASYALDSEGLYFLDGAGGGYGIRLTTPGVVAEYVLGLLNSKLLDWRLRKRSSLFRGQWWAFQKNYLSVLPINLEADEADVRSITSDVVRMNELHRRLAAKGGIQDAEVEVIAREIRETDQAIDELVYNLYGLTADERRMIEEEVGPRR